MMIIILSSIFKGLIDEQQKVRTITALAIAALAEAATPYGIESFDSVLKPLWKGIRQHRGKVGFISTATLFSDLMLIVHHLCTRVVSLEKLVINSLFRFLEVDCIQKSVDYCLLVYYF